jgi:mannitol/fructose-specific phosphotransferase system IIA component (Ntr-type)
MNLAEMLNKEHIYIADNFDDTDHFYSEYSAFLSQAGVVNDQDTIKRLFIKRENVQSTAIGKGASAPHIFSTEFSRFIFSVALIKEGLDFKAPDEEKVYFVFLIMSDERDVGLHLKTLAHIARLVSSTEIVEDVKKSAGAEDIIRILAENEAKI